MLDSILLLTSFQNNELVPQHSSKAAHMFFKYCYECMGSTDPPCFNTLQRLFLQVYPSLDAVVLSLASMSLCMLAPVCFESFITNHWAFECDKMLQAQLKPFSSQTGISQFFSDALVPFSGKGIWRLQDECQRINFFCIGYWFQNFSQWTESEICLTEKHFRSSY